MISLKTHSISIISKGFQLGSAFLLFILTSRWLGADGRGEISLYIANQTILQLATEIIFGSGYIYLIHRYERGSIIFKGLIWSLLCSLILPIIFYWLGIQPFDSMGWLTLSSFLYSLFTWMTLDIRAQERIGLYNVLWIIYSTLLLIYFIILFSLYKDAASYYMSISAALLSVIFIGLYFVIRTKFPPHSQPIAWKSLLKEGSSSVWSNWINFFSTRSSFYIITWFIQKESAVGLYAAAAMFSELIWIIPYALAIPLYPLISKSNSSLDTLKYVNTTALLNAQLSIVAFLFLLLVPESIITAVIGESFTGIKPIILLLIPGTYFLSQGKIYWNYFQGTGGFIVNTRTALYSFVVTVALLILLVPFLGLNGAAIATGIGYILYAYLLIKNYQKVDNKSILYYFFPFARKDN